MATIRLVCKSCRKAFRVEKVPPKPMRCRACGKGLLVEEWGAQPSSSQPKAKGKSRAWLLIGGAAGIAGATCVCLMVGIFFLPLLPRFRTKIEDTKEDAPLEANKDPGPAKIDPADQAIMGNPTIVKLRGLGARLTLNDQREVIAVDSYLALRDDDLPLLEKLPRVKKVSLTGHITDAGLAHLGKVNQIEELKLCATTCTHQGLAHLTGLTNLRTLELLESPALKGPGLAHLSKLPRLAILDLQICPEITPAELPHLQGIKTLEVLRLPSTCDGVVALPCVKDMEQLTELHLMEGLRHDKVKDDDLKHLAKLKKLQVLHLSSGITDKGLAHVRHLTELRTLWLSDVKLSSSWPDAFAGMKKLTTLHVRGKLDFSSVGSLQGLETIHLTYSNLGSPLRHCKTLPKLRALYFAGSSDRGDDAKDEALAGFGDLEHLAEAQISGPFGGTPFAKAKGLKKLRRLTVYMDRETKPAQLAGLNEIGVEDLNLGSFDMSADEIMAHVQGMPGLRNLSLSLVGLGDAGVSKLANHPTLEDLSIRTRNDFGDPSAEHLKTIPRLRRLTLQSEITDKGLATLAEPGRLEVLILEGARISDAGLAHLKSLPKLRELSLDNSEITAAGLGHVRPLSQLERLSLSGTKIGDEGLAQISGLRNLHTLDLSQTNITDAGLVHLRGLSKLQKLNLFKTGITDSGLSHLDTLHQLRWMNASDTKTTREGQGRLASKLPRLGGPD